MIIRAEEDFLRLIYLSWSLSLSLIEEATKPFRDRQLEPPSSPTTTMRQTMGLQVGMALVGAIALAAIICYAKFYRRMLDAHWASKIAAGVRSMQVMTEEGSESKLGEGEDDPMIMIPMSTRRPSSSDLVSNNPFVIEDPDENIEEPQSTED